MCSPKHKEWEFPGGLGVKDSTLSLLWFVIIMAQVQSLAWGTYTCYRQLPPQKIRIIQLKMPTEPRVRNPALNYYHNKVLVLTVLIQNDFSGNQAIGFKKIIIALI